MADITVGYNGAATSTDGAKMVVDKNSAATGTGVIDTVHVKLLGNGTGCKVAPFYNNGGTLTCRGGAVSIGNITGGSYQAITGLAMEITSGDFIGLYAGGAGIYYATASLAGYYAGADKTNAGDTVTGGFGDVKFAVYGSGSTASGLPIAIAQYHRNNMRG